MTPAPTKKASPFLTTAQAAAYLGVSHDVMYQHRINGTGPPFVQVSPNIFKYRPEDIDRWYDEQRATVAVPKPRKRRRRANSRVPEAPRA